MLDQMADEMLTKCVHHIQEADLCNTVRCTHLRNPTTMMCGLRAFQDSPGDWWTEGRSQRQPMQLCQCQTHQRTDCTFLRPCGMNWSHRSRWQLPKAKNVARAKMENSKGQFQHQTSPNPKVKSKPVPLPSQSPQQSERQPSLKPLNNWLSSFEETLWTWMKIQEQRMMRCSPSG